MGGHGGLNILPQKRWNVYNRENRLKVARDEAKYEEEQKEAREKHEQAEREFRHRMLLDRARQRYGARDAIEGGEGQPGLLATSHGPAGEAEGQAGFQVDYEALHSLAGGAGAGRAGWQQQEGENCAAAAGGDLHVPRQQQGAKEDWADEDGRRTLHERRRERRRERRQEGGTSCGGPGGAAAAAGAGRAPSLAQLAQQLQSGAAAAAAGPAWPGDADGSRAGHEEHSAAGDAARAAAQQIANRFTGEHLEHINLFADEERKARNPETEEEKRAERRRRGNPDTQTSDPKFDEKFRLGYGLTGKEAMPWYAKHAATLPGSAIEHTQPPDHHAAQLDQWRKAGQAALAAGTQSAEAPEPGNPEQPRLLGSVRVTAAGAPAGVDGKGNRGREKKGRRRRHSRRSSSSSTSESSSGSDSESSRERRKRRRKSKKRKEKKNGGSRGKKGGSGGIIERLRHERLEREAAEQQRQQRVLQEHVAALRQGEPEGRRYHGAFGLHRPPLGGR